MGEYANYRGDCIKVGTCEDMYYLRWDQRRKVSESETDFADENILEVVRFRFPWPDEDGNAPGDFKDAFRGLTLWGFEQPELDHGSVPFSAQNGYLVSLPCPEDPISGDSPEYVIHRNGYGGPAELVQQAYRGGQLVGIARCKGCRALYRLEDGHELAAAVSIRAQADRRIRDRDTYNYGNPGEPITGDNGAGFYHAIADRLLAGYALESV